MFRTEYETSSVDADAMLPTKFGDFRIRSFHDESVDKEHALLYTGQDQSKMPLVRIHSECLTGDAFGSLRCDCGEQLETSMKEIQENMSLEEWNMIKVFQESINAIESARKKSNRLAVVQYWRAGKLETHENYMSAYDNLRNIERSIIEPANALFEGRIRIEVEDIAQ